LGARFVASYVEKQRRLANNLVPVKVPPQPPVEVGAVWTTPNPNASEAGQPAAKMHTGKFYVGADGAVTGPLQAGKGAKPAQVASRAAKNQTASTKQIPGSTRAVSSKPERSGGESAKLDSMAALPARPTSVKPR
jgi:hypothetical protein